MKSRFIQREEWGICFEDFTRRHEGRLGRHDASAAQRRPCHVSWHQFAGVRTSV